jgi:hypothetical protein
MPRILPVSRHPGVFLLVFALLVLPCDGFARDSKAENPSLSHVDHSVFDRLLRSYVDDSGLVNYRAWKSRDEETLRNYLKSLDKVRPDLLGRPEELAFWINAYNALTIQGILEFYPIQSIKDKVNRILGFNIWDDYPMAVNGKAYSLNDIEHKILRKMGEPRIHFAIVCASVGCPKLLSEAYAGVNLDRRLEDQAIHFFAQQRNFRIDRARKTVHLSSILDWFGEDFGGSDSAKLDFVSKYLSEAKDREFLRSGGLKVKYLDYDWSLNEQPQTNRASPYSDRENDHGRGRNPHWTERGGTEQRIIWRYQTYRFRFRQVSPR